ncbi:MAG: crossover junction endodeoxyribonuclease RuvC [Candidatus Wolfebacteria bacterium]|nr:crossover junction endodeoxyribonuclease RuvC [Candidatus Wolfebacteria bacterium]
MTILGIDPGSARIGYGVIKKEKSGLKFVRSGLLKIASKDKNERLVELESSLLKLIKKEKPDLVAMEKLYFAKNVKTAVEVSESRGILTLAVIKNKIALLEFTPLEIKRAITGYGLSDKKSMMKAVSRILKIGKIEGGDDAADALAAAMTGSFHNYNH